MNECIFEEEFIPPPNAEAKPSLPPIGTKGEGFPFHFSGIYIIRNILNGMFYLGSAKSIGRRWAVHRCELKGRGHKNSHLQSAWNKYGERSFEFIVIERVNLRDMTDREQWYLDTFRPFDRHIGYNLAESAYHPRLGAKLSDETKRIIGEKSRGRTHRGHVHSDEVRAYLSRLFKGRKHTPEACAKIGEASRRLVRTKEWCKNISEGQKGRVIPDWQRAMISKTLTGRKRSAEALIKQSVSLKKAFSTPEQKERRSKATKAMWSSQEFRAKRLASFQETIRKRNEKNEV